MRIVIAGNYNEKKAGANFYATIRKLTNGFTRNGHAVIGFSDRDVAREGSDLGIGRRGNAGANLRLVELARNYQPDLLILMHADRISNETIATIRKMLPHLRVAVINLDPIFLSENPPRIRRFAEVVDVTFITTAGDHLAPFASATHRMAYMPNPTDASIETLQCFTHEDQPFDLFCSIGSEKGTPWRGDALRAIATAVPECRTAFYGLEGQPAVFGQAYFDAISRAKMGLNLNRADDHKLYSSDRLAQYAGNGLLVFIARSTGYDEIFSDEEFVFYRDQAELADRLRYFLENDGERQRIARNGHSRYHAIFNERVVARYIEEITFGKPMSPDYGWQSDVYGG